MKKTVKFIGLILFASAILTGCGPNKEERAKSCNCDDSEQKYWYNKGATVGHIAKISDDGKRDCDWAENFAIDNSNELVGFPTDEEKYGDCWRKGFLESFDEK
jgi:hypothetical protein